MLIDSRPASRRCDSRMMPMKATVIIILFCIQEAIWGIPLSEFYPYGLNSLEATGRMGNGHNTFSPRILTQKLFCFYGQQHESVVVCVNGAISFNRKAAEFTSNPFPLGNNRKLIAPFWADIDTSRKGNVWYHESSDPVFLKRASNEILKVYPEENYTAESLFIATWEKVGYYNAATTKANTFQCVLATDGKESYAIFLYADNEIQWTTGDADGGINGLGGIPAQVGFNKGDGTGFTAINNSRTEHIIRVASASNTGLPGILVFKISDVNISIRNLNFTSDDDDITFISEFGAYDYYLGFIINYNGGKTSLLIMTTVSQPVSYSVQAPGIGFYHNGTVTADNEVILDLPSAVEVTSHNDQNKGIYLKTSSSSVTVIGQSVLTGTDDTFLVQPIVRLSVDMYVYYGMSVPRTIAHRELRHSSILLVGTEDNTITKLITTQSVTTSVGDTTIALTPGTQYSFVINRLQTIYIESLEDLTGTKVATNKPISVFSGHECANVPYDIAFCGYAVEQIPPTTLWGKVHYTVPLATRKSYTIKILAAHDSTKVNIYCNNSLDSYTINEGEFLNKSLQLQEYCALISDENVLVVKFAHGTQDGGLGEPMMAIVPATNQYDYKLQFSTLRNKQYTYRHYVNIIVMAQYYQPDIIYLIAGSVNKSLNTQQWVPIKVNNIIEAYATQVSIPEGVVEVVHANTAAQMTAVVYGFGNDGYGHPGELNFKTTSGSPPYFIISPSNQTITLSADSYNISLSCEANGTLSYIWDRQNGGIPSGAIGKNTSTLTLINVQPKDSGNYRCVATNRYGFNISDYATITIKSELCEVTSITGVVRVDGNDVTITFSISDSAAEFQCKLDSEMLSPCSSPNTWRNVNSGEHSITVVARCTGQEEALEKSFAFQIP